MGPLSVFQAGYDKGKTVWECNPTDKKRNLYRRNPAKGRYFILLYVTLVNLRVKLSLHPKNKARVA